MLERYSSMIDAMPRPVQLDLLKYFGMIPRTRSGDRGRLPVASMLSLLGLCQADVVLALLRLKHLKQAEILIGKPIHRCPPSLRSGIRPVPPDKLRSASGDDRRVIHVIPNPRQSNTPAWHRWKIIQLGRTVTQMLARGLSRRDLRLAMDYDWVRLS